MYRISVWTRSSSRYAGGPYYSVSGLFKPIKKAGNEIRVFSKRDEFSDLDRLQWGEIPVHDCNPDVSFDPYGHSLKMLRSASDAPADFVSLHGLWDFSVVAAKVASKKWGAPLVINPHGMLDAIRLKRSAIKKRFIRAFYERAAFDRASGFRALTPAEARSIRESGAAQPIAVIPNGIDLRESPLPVFQGPTREMLYLGRIDPLKGIFDLVEAWSAGAGRPGNWSLKIAGWGAADQVSRLGSMIKAVNRSDISYIGPAFGEQKAALLASSDAFILPSYSEGLPMTVLEAWAVGLPTLITNECNLTAAFKNDSAFRVTPGVDGIKEGLADFFDLDEIAAKEIGLRGFEYCSRNHSWSRISSQYLSFFEWLRGGGQRPSYVL